MRIRLEAFGDLTKVSPNHLTSGALSAIVLAKMGFNGAHVTVNDAVRIAAWADGDLPSGEALEALAREGALRLLKTYRRGAARAVVQR